mgnify:CR=1 FL=1
MLLDILGSAGFGTAIGALFGWLNKREERENMKLQYDHQVNLIKANTEATVQLANIKIEEIQAKTKQLMEEWDARAFERSQQTSGALAEGLKAVVRPAILVLLMYQTYLILDSLDTMVGGVAGLPSEDVIGLFRTAVLSILSLTSTAVGWYYGTRTSKQFDRMMTEMRRTK